MEADRRLTLAVSPQARYPCVGRLGGVTVADRSYLTRLRAAGGPSHDLLVLLDAHRVMTSGQLARATCASERTVRYRMERLHEANLVECARPGRERGSAPRHWWLRPAGARLVAGTAAAEGRPSAMFAAHAAAITEVWLALTEHGPSQGIETVRWLTDRAGWQEWQRADRWSTHPHRLTPDAVATLTLDGAECVVFVEVDLASMTQTVLKQKVARYQAYAADLAWQDRYPYCPPMLLLTTTATRAATFVRAAGQVLTPQRRRADANDPAAALVTAACGHVRDPARAVTEPCWVLPDTSTAELTLAELLTERLDAQKTSQAWLYERDVVQQRKDNISALRAMAQFAGLDEWLGSPKAAEAITVLIGIDPAAFLDNEPDLAGQVLDWYAQRRRLDKFRARALASPLVADLANRYTAIWAEQVHRLLAAQDHIAADQPHLHGLAKTLSRGALASIDEMDLLDTPPATTRAQIQQRLLGDYASSRTAVLDEEWQRYDRRARRHITREQLATAYDDKHLAVCDTCALIYQVDAKTPFRCTYCGANLLDWPDRTSVPSLAQRLEALRRQLSTRVMASRPRAGDQQ